MFSSARQVCARRIAVASPLPAGLPAESSRQALLRANAVAAAAVAARASIHSDATRSTGVPSGSRQENGKEQMMMSARGSGGKTRGISSGSTSSAAMAMAEREAERDRHPNDDHLHNHQSSRYRPRDEALTEELSPRPPDVYGPAGIVPKSSTLLDDSIEDEPVILPPDEHTTPEWLRSWTENYDVEKLPPSPLSPLQTFRGLVLTHPILALLTLCRLSQPDVSRLRHNDVKTLLNRCRRVLDKYPTIPSRLDPEISRKALRTLRAILYALPSTQSASDAFMGNYFNGKTVQQFFHLCVRLGAPRLAIKVLDERTKEHLARESEPKLISNNQSNPIPFDSIARDLSVLREWGSIIEIFSPSSFPHRYYTPNVIAIYMQAHFGIHQGSKVPQIFGMYDILNMTPTPEAFNHLVQSFLEIGDLPMARTVVQEAKISGISDYTQQQLSILRGYRALGMDVDLEKRVLGDIERLGLPLESRLLNALIRLRIEADDYHGAEMLMGRFDMTDWGRGAHGGVRPSAATAKLAFQLSTTSGGPQRLSDVWKKLKEKEVVDDDIINTLVRAMVSCGLFNEAATMLGLPPGSDIRTATLDYTNHDWILPQGVKPGLRSLNYLLGELCRQRGLLGMEQGLALIHSLDVKPDNLTFKTMVDAVRSIVQQTPNKLAELVTRIMNATNLEPSQSMLDSILAEAVVAGARAQSRGMLPSELEASRDQDTRTPTAGLEVAPSLKAALKPVLSSLDQFKSQSTSRSLANRLRFDAMTSSTIDGLPSARLVWNSLIARGYKPDDRHFVALMRGYRDAGHMHQAQDLLVLAEQVGVKATIPMHFTLLVGWGKIQRPKMAQSAYERIKLLSPNHQPSLGVVTAMIQALVHSGQWGEAVKMCYTDLQKLDVPLDRKAVIVAAQALRHTGQFRGALELFKRHGRALDPVSRTIVRGIKNYQRKALGLNVPSIAQGDELAQLVEKDLWTNEKKRLKMKDDQEILYMAEALLKRDDRARPRDKGRRKKLDKRLARKLVKAFVGPTPSTIDGEEGSEDDLVQGRGRARGTPVGARAITAPLLNTDLSSASAANGDGNRVEARVARGSDWQPIHVGGEAARNRRRRRRLAARRQTWARIRAQKKAQKAEFRELEEGVDSVSPIPCPRDA